MIFQRKSILLSPREFSAQLFAASVFELVERGSRLPLFALIFSPLFQVCFAFPLIGSLGRFWRFQLGPLDSSSTSGASLESAESLSSDILNSVSESEATLRVSERADSVLSMSIVQD